MHMLYDRFCLSYNLTNGEWWVQDRFEHMGVYGRYSQALAAIDNRIGEEAQEAFNQCLDAVGA